MPTGITKLQQQLISLIGKHEAERGSPPSTGKLSKLTGRNPHGYVDYGIYRSLTSLEKRGLVAHSPFWRRDGFRWTADPERIAAYLHNRRPSPGVRITVGDMTIESNVSTFEEFKALLKPVPVSVVSSLQDPEMQALVQEERRLMVGFDDFIRHDKQNRQEVLLNVRKELEAWFTNGVIYSGSWFEPFLPCPEYVNMPEELHPILEIAQGQIMKNVLEWKQVPLRLWPELLRFSAPVPLDGEDELNATFSLRPIHPPLEPVYKTEDVAPRERADKIANIWYKATARRAFRFVSSIYRGLRNEGAGATSPRDVDEYSQIEQALRSSRKSTLDILLFHTCEAYRHAEAVDVMRQIGVNKTEEEVKEDHRKARNILIEKGIITPKLLS